MLTQNAFQKTQGANQKKRRARQKTHFLASEMVWRVPVLVWPCYGLKELVIYLLGQRN